MAKIREADDLTGPNWWVEMYHIGAPGYARGLYPYDFTAGGILPPWPPGFMPSSGHLLFVPSITPLDPSQDVFRRFDILNETWAWDFFYEMLGAPYRIISRCRWCFPEHRYLTI